MRWSEYTKERLPKITLEIHYSFIFITIVFMIASKNRYQRLPYLRNVT